jgi:hypothetical protein
MDQTLFMKQKHLVLKIGILTITLLVLNLVAIYTVAKPAYDQGILWLSRRVLFVIGLWCLAALLNLAIFIGTLFFWETLESRFFAGFYRATRLRWISLVIFGTLLIGFVFLLMGPLHAYYQQLLLRVILYVQVVIAATVFLLAFTYRFVWHEILVLSTLLTAFIVKVASFLSSITSYPFSIDWSEGSQHYFASLFFSERIYGQKLPLPVLHPSQYFLQSLPFLIPDSPLWFHRFWEVLLWLGFSITTGWLIARRVKPMNPVSRWIIITWIFLYLLIGPVYYHLLFMVVLILWAFDPLPLTKTGFIASIGVVMLASIWAGISRVNWFPVPGILAAGLYFLRMPKNRQSFSRYLIKPIIWVGLGTATACLTYLIYINFSGNPLDQFASSFESTLLWNRLLPNVTYRIGILPAILLVSIPLWLIIVIPLIGHWRSYHFIRYICLVGMLLTLFLGGLVVSVKIGGGSNLHNMDAYMILLMLIAVLVYFNMFIPEAEYGWNRKVPSEQIAHGSSFTTPTFSDSFLYRFSIVIALMVPILFTLRSVRAMDLPSQKVVQASLANIRYYTHEAIQQGGQVLFISERHLLTFRDIRGVPLIPEYEKIILMEMAMSGNEGYMGRFNQDIKDHSYSLIITDPINLTKQSDKGKFGEENKVWRKYVNKQITCYYELVSSMTDVGFEIFVPRMKDNCE